MKIILADYLPRPKARPRIFKGGVYSPTGRNEAGLAFLIRSEINRQQIRTPIAGNTFSVQITLSTRGNFRGDLDNYVKAILDALKTARVYQDDRAVKLLSCELRENQGTTFSQIEVTPILQFP